MDPTTCSTTAKRIIQETSNEISLDDRLRAIVAKMEFDELGWELPLCPTLFSLAIMRKKGEKIDHILKRLWEIKKGTKSGSLFF
jgi:hypothetical protein